MSVRSRVQPLRQPVGSGESPKAVRAVLAQALRVSMAPNWSPRMGAQMVLDRVHGNVSLLLRARGRLLSRAGEQLTPYQARAEETLNAAIATVEDQQGDGDQKRASGDQ